MGNLNNPTIVAGNWKMNLHLEEAKKLVKKITASIPTGQAKARLEIILAPPYPYLLAVGEMIKQSTLIKLGAQDVHYEDNGAYTGKVSVSMLKDTGVSYSIVGHSEQRKYFHETNNSINLKIKKLLASGLSPIFCLGETLAEREAGKLNSVLSEQLNTGLKDISPKEMEKIIIAYEPVWAIGTGKSATSEEADEAHRIIRELLNEIFNEASAIAQTTTILYGGSVKASNAGELFQKPNINGGLIGGASLKSEEFLGIIQAAVH